MQLFILKIFGEIAPVIQLQTSEKYGLFSQKNYSHHMAVVRVLTGRVQAFLENG